MQMQIRQHGQFTRLNLLLSTITMPRAKTTHGRLKPISCPWCSKKFCSETNVLQHMNQPTGSCYTDFFSKTLLGSEFSPDVPTMESGAEQVEISTHCRHFTMFCQKILENIQWKDTLFHKNKSWKTCYIFFPITFWTGQSASRKQHFLDENI